MSSGDLDKQSLAFDQLVMEYRVSYLLQRIIKNLALINSSPDSQKVIVANANLYQLAAQYYGDWTLWQTIQKANNLTDFIVDGIDTLIIPPKPTSNG